MDRIIKTSKGIGPINPDERKDCPYMKNPNNMDLTNPLIGVKLEGVKEANKIRINQSDYTPSVGREKN